MGTRSLTFVFESYKDGDVPILCLYRQYDGYPSGHGAELAEFLKGKRLVNGMSGDTSMVFNGMGCLAASLVANFKTAAGQFYIHAPIEGRDDCQDYEYHVYADKIRVVSCYGDKEVIFLGSWEDFSAFCSAEEIA